MWFKFRANYDSIFVLDACQHAFFGAQCEAEKRLEHSTLSHKVKDIELRVDPFASFIQEFCFSPIPPTAVTQIESNG